MKKIGVVPIILFLFFLSSCPVEEDTSSSNNSGGDTAVDYRVPLNIPVKDIPPIAELPSQGPGNIYFVSVQGKEGNPGTPEAPFSLSYAFSGANGIIQPGDCIWIQQGEYAGKFKVTVQGTKEQPIIFRSIPNHRVALNSGGTRGTALHNTNYTLGFGTNFVWMWGLEVTCSDKNRWHPEKGSNPPGLFRRGGISITGGEGIKIINCIVYDTGGINVWKAAKDIEIYGSMSYNNGWVAPDRGHTHGNYMQGRKGNRKIFAETIMFNNFGGFGHHIYGSANADLYDFTMIGNFHCDNTFLYGGESGTVSRAGGIIIREEMTYRSSTRIGYRKSPNQDVIVENNYFSGTSDIKYWQNANLSGNTFLGQVRYTFYDGGSVAANVTSDNNSFGSTISVSGDKTYTLSQWKELGQDANSVSVTRQNRIFVRPNKYETGRANIFVYNWENHPSAVIDISSTGLQAGDAFEVRNAFDFNGPLVIDSTYDGSGSITLEMKEYTYALPLGADEDSRINKFIRQHPGQEFGAFILIKK